MKRILLTFLVIASSLGLVGYLTHGFPQPIFVDFTTAAAAGWLDGGGVAHPITSTVAINKFGANGDADTTEDSVANLKDIGGPDRCFNVLGTTAAPLYISSNNDLDAGKGVTVEALDGNWDQVTIAETLGTANGDGTTFEQIGSVNLLRVNRAYATSDALIGTVYIHIDNEDVDTDGIPDTLPTDVVAGINAGANQTLQACYTVPNDYNALLTQWCTTNVNTAANATMSFRLRKSVEGAAARVQERLDLNEGDSHCTPHHPPILFNEKTDIEVTSVGSQNNAATTATFDLILVKDTL